MLVQVNFIGEASGCYSGGMQSQSSQSNKARRRKEGLPAITPEAICDAAISLTKEKGLEGWSMRDLAAELDAYVRVIYYHVGDRDAVTSLVIERVLSEVAIPSAASGWRAWFDDLLRGLRDVMRRYPGVAKRFALVGPGGHAARAIAETGISLLREAGFGELSVPAFSLLLEQTCQFVAQEDDRDALPSLRKSAASEYAACAGVPGGMGDLSKSVAHATTSESSLRRYYDDSFDFFLRTVLDGLEVRLSNMRG